MLILKYKIRFLLTALLLACLPSVMYAGAETGTPSLKEWRQKAADRQRRVIFNNDGHDLVAHTRKPTAEGILAKRTAELAGTQVDTIFYCTLCAGFGNFTHFTKVGNMILLRDPPLENNPLPDLYNAGIDPLQVMVDFAHGNKMECFWSMRMNDTHDSGTRDHRPVLFNSNKLKLEHPEYLLGAKGEKMAQGGWSGVNYALPQIRELAFRFVEEVCQNYDIDGIELDFFRHPVFFKTTANGKPVTPQELEQMTELMRRIRSMADKRGRERGRPILIAMRMPDSVEYSKIMGLDMEKWMAEDLLDIYIATSYLQLNNWDYSVALARKYNIKIYPSLDESRIPDEKGLDLRKSIEAYRGRAANAWASGVDGIYLFNMFNPKSSVWTELGSPTLLGQLDKDYFASIRGVARAAGGNYPHEKFLRIETLNPAAPRTIKPGEIASASIRTGENANDIADDTKITLRLRFKSITESTPVAVTFNGEKPSSAEVIDNWLEFPLRREWLRKGANLVEVALDKKSKQITWMDLMISLRSKQPYRIEEAAFLRNEWDNIFAQTRAAVIPGKSPRFIVTAQDTDPRVTHGYRDMYMMESTNNGRSWTKPVVIESLKRKRVADGNYDFVMGDVCPQWHAATGVVLATGKTFGFREGVKEDRGLERVSYAVFNPKKNTWSGLRLLDMPEKDHEGLAILEPNAGCHQRFDLPNGEILLPIRYRKNPEFRAYTTMVARCRFDGEKLTYIEHGSEFNIPVPRGLYEPSVIGYNGKYFLTMRAENSAFVARGNDGVNYEPFIEWKYDDGQVLGSYNTQQHWIAHSDALYLVYTRKGANNDHVFRHRAPLFMAQVDPEKLCVIRSTERILMAENKGDLGAGFWVLDASPEETWVISAETPPGKKPDGNRVVLARVLWKTPNKLVSPGK